MTNKKSVKKVVKKVASMKNVAVRDQRVETRLTKKEKQTLIQRAKNAKVDRGTYIRTKLSL